MLYNTYRPQRFTEVVGQKEVMENLISQSMKDKFFSVYILCGQFGSGKTTTARILAMAANCQHKDENGNPCGTCESCRSIMENTAVDVQEIAAAVSTGVDTVREICENVSFMPVALRKKVYIIDEVQALSKAAFQAFLKMLEEPPAHAMFILATTDVGAIPPTVRSRAATYYFKQLTQDEIAGHLESVARKEGLSTTEDTFAVIAKYSQGSMRNALSLLDMATQDGTGATGEKVEKLLGVSTPDSVFKILREVLAGNAANIIMEVNALAEGGADAGVLVSDLLSAASDLTVASVSPESVRGAEHYLSLIRETVVHGSSVKFSAIADELFSAKQKMSKNPEFSNLIVSLIRLSRRDDVVAYREVPGEDIASLRNTVSMLEKKLRLLEESVSSGSVVSVQQTPLPQNSEVVTITEEETATDVQEEVCDAETEKGLIETKVEVTEEEANEATDLEPDGELMESDGDDKVQEMYEEPTELHEEVCAPEESASSDEEADEIGGMNIFSFLGIGMAKKSVHKESIGAKNQRELEKDALYGAVMSCFDVEEEGDEVILSSELPIAEKFASLLIPAYENRGYDITGIKIG